MLARWERSAEQMCRQRVGEALNSGRCSERPHALKFATCVIRCRALDQRFGPTARSTEGVGRHHRERAVQLITGSFQLPSTGWVERCATSDPRGPAEDVGVNHDGVDFTVVSSLHHAGRECTCAVTIQQFSDALHAASTIRARALTSRRELRTVGRGHGPVGMANRTFQSGSQLADVPYLSGLVRAVVVVICAAAAPGYYQW